MKASRQDLPSLARAVCSCSLHLNRLQLSKSFGLWGDEKQTTATAQGYVARKRTNAQFPRRKPDIQQVAISSKHLKNSALKGVSTNEIKITVKMPCSVVSHH